MNKKQKILAGVPVKKQRASRELPDVWARLWVFEKCELYLVYYTLSDNVQRSYFRDCKTTEIKADYRYSFKEFAIDALLKYPNAYKIDLDYLGSRTIMVQGDLLAMRWEKRDGLWWEVPISWCNLDIYYNVGYKEDKEELKLATYLN